MNNHAPTRQRKSVRLKGYDYRRAGTYFITICTYGRAEVLGHVHDREVRLSREGQVAEEAWLWLEKRYDYVQLDEYVVMPNHLHAILNIVDSPTSRRRTAADGQKRKPLGQLVGAFKTVTTNQVNALRAASGLPLWQRNYYEHIIRTEESLGSIRSYIASNPLNWMLDPENPDALRRRETCGKIEPWRV